MSGMVKLNERDDLLLVRKIRAGDADAFRVLLERYKDRVYSSIYRVIGNADDADNLVQETFFKVYKGLDSFKEESKFYTWLYRIAMNQCATHLRKMKTTKHQRLLSLDSFRSGQDDSSPKQIADRTLTPSEHAMGQEKQVLIQQAICELEPDMRRVVVLKDVENFSYEEIARIIDCPLGTVKSRLYKAREILRLRLQRFLS